MSKWTDKNRLNALERFGIVCPEFTVSFRRQCGRNFVEIQDEEGEVVVFGETLRDAIDQLLEISKAAKKLPRPVVLP